MIYLRLYKPIENGFIIQSVNRNGDVTDCGNIISSFGYDYDDTPLVISVCHGYNKYLGFPKYEFDANLYEVIIE